MEKVKKDEKAQINWLFVFLTILLIGLSFTTFRFWKKVQTLEKVAGERVQIDSSQSIVPLAGDPFSGENLKLYADHLGLDPQKFEQCLENSTYEAQVQQDHREGVRVGVTGTPAFFINGRLISGAQRWEVFEEIIAQESGEKPIPSGAKRVELEAKGPAVGSPNTKVVVVEFSDFGCPFCAEAYGIDAVPGVKYPTDEDNVVPRLRKLAQEGEIYFVYRQFAPKAPLAAEASLCAGEQGKFWEYHDLLFEVRYEK